MDKATKKKIIIISVIDLLFAILLVKFKLIFSFGIYFKELTYIALLSCGIINYFFFIKFIKKTGLWEHAKFFIPFSIAAALFFKLVYILYYILLANFYCKGCYGRSGFTESFFSGIMRFAFIFFIGTLMGSALKDIIDKRVRKKLSIRLIVYPIVFLIILFLIQFTWRTYKVGQLDLALKKQILLLKLKFNGITYCETPEEAIQLYANALIKNNREEAVKYVEKYQRDKNLVSYTDKTDEELRNEGENLLKGHLLCKDQNGWGIFTTWVSPEIANGHIEYPVKQLIYNEATWRYPIVGDKDTKHADIQLLYNEKEGWKIK